MGKIKTYSLAFLVLSLSACQSLNTRYCKSVNWRELGSTSALAGKDKTKTFTENISLCPKTKFPVDEAGYYEGFERGLAQFCTVSNGYDFGAKGALYNKTCSSSAEGGFLKGYYKGRVDYLNRELSKHSELYTEAEDRLWRKEREYLIIQNEDPEQAKLEVDIIEAYREEARMLSQKKRALKKEIIQTKKASEESYF
ncbi:MAG: DUF2799 domain-containing protein [Bdellovibrionales bacterium]